MRECSCGQRHDKDCQAEDEPGDGRAGEVHPEHFDAFRPIETCPMQRFTES
jgi:hypothetical protein